MKEKLCRVIEENKDKIIDWGRELLSMPEYGYKEVKSSAFVRNVFDELSVPYKYPFAVTGIKGEIKGKSDDVNICIIGELDAVCSYEHPYSDPLTGAAHACGHNAQVAAMLGVAMGFAKSGIMNELFGRLSFIAAPAEEFIDIEYRYRLKNEGKIEYFGGKQQLIYEKAFSDVDIAIMLHSQANTPVGVIYPDCTSLGFTAKEIAFKGIEAHGAEPFDGINALNAAALSIMGINCNRETFRDEDNIRIHPIITKGGDIVNTVPADVRMETYVRGSNREAIEKAAEKVDRAVKGAAYSVGAEAFINNAGGYLPLKQNKELALIIGENAEALGWNAVYGSRMTGSTDMGDLGHYIPCIHPTIGGFSGTAHSKNFKIEDEEAVYIASAKLIAMTVYDLLSNKALIAKSIKENFKGEKICGQKKN